MQRGAMQPFISVVAEQWASMALSRLEGVLCSPVNDDAVSLRVLNVSALHMQWAPLRALALEHACRA